MFEGVFTALVTPFRDGAVDERGLREIIERQIAAGVDGLVPCGSTGESATLSAEEHHRTVEITVDAARDRVQVMAGTGSNNTREAIDFTTRAKQAGADGALLISPYYNKPTQAGIVAHYAAVAQETAFPLFVYNIPGRTASNILPATMARLAELEHVVGVKEACGDIVQISEALALCPDDFTFVAGDCAITLPLIACGGRGVISATACVAPAEMVELVRAARSGDFSTARAIHNRLLPLFDILFCETNPIPVKTGVAMQCGIDATLRLPLTPMTDVNRERLQGILKELRLL